VGEAHRVASADAVEEAAEEAGEAKAPARPAATAVIPSEHQGKHARRAPADRHADADLPPALLDEVGEDAVVPTAAIASAITVRRPIGGR